MHEAEGTKVRQTASRIERLGDLEVVQKVSCLGECPYYLRADVTFLEQLKFCLPSSCLKGVYYVSRVSPSPC